MDLDVSKERHATLKRKATEIISETLGCGQSSSAKRKTQLSKLRDFESYKNIIKTYKAPHWLGCAVSPRDLADYGWSCVKKNSVKCVECDEVLNTTLPKITKVNINVYNASLKHIYEKMISSHKNTCKQKAGSPQFRMIEPTSKEIMEGIDERLAPALSFKESDIIVDVPLGISLPKMDLFAPNFVFVSSLGWKISKSRRGYMALLCDHCAREVVVKCEIKFDPVHNHERWCPRIDKNENGEPAWQTDLKIVLNTKNKTLDNATSSNLYKDVYQARRLIQNSVSSIIPSHMG